MIRSIASWWRASNCALRLLFSLSFSLASYSVAAAEPALPVRIEFNRDVRPILADHCFTCHGPDNNKREAELRLDSELGLRGTAEKPGVVVAGQPDKSELVLRIFNTDPEEMMPPPKAEKPLTDRQKAILKTWIEQGANWQGHWAYEPLLKPELPTAEVGPNGNAIDHFIHAKLTSHQLHPAAEADRVTLIRRLSFDLTGLPPKPEEVAAFVSDLGPDAYAQLVERLLASPHFGERMAVYWLDLVRFADTAGYHSDNPRDITPYRDYVIRSFNENKPFDQFTTEQLAGDLLPNPTTQQKVASGYNRLLQTTEEGGAQAKEYVAKYNADRVRNVSTVWLGSTMMCCECHTHKFDPFTIQDFYSLGAFFADVQESPIGRREPGMPVPTDELQAMLTEFDVAIAAATTKLAQLADERAATASTDLASVIAWQPVQPTEAKVQGESQLAVQPDGSLKSTGKVAAKENYLLRFKLPAAAVTGVRLEAMTDADLPAKGPGTAPNGNFVLTEFKVETIAADGPKPVKLIKAVADHSQNGHDIGTAIDGNNESGWAVLQQIGQPHEALFQFEKPLGVAGDEIQIQLQFQSQYAQHNIGRFRISLTTSDQPVEQGAPPAVQAALAIEASKRTAEQKAEIATYLRDSSPELQPQRDALKQLQDQKAALLKTVPASLISTSGTPRTVRVLARGNWMDDSGAEVTPQIPSQFKPLTAEGRRLNRLDLAQWMTSKENPLTSRVFMNRLWKMYFGQGLSKTVEDLGTQGEWPTHPELLEWLSVEFRDSGWDMKQMIRLMVTSETYRRSSVLSAEAKAADPFNRLLSSQSRVRLDAEFIRDNALAVAGLLSPRIGGESDFPYQPTGYWEYLNFPGRTWPDDSGERQHRRGMYTHWQRSFLHPSLLAFDAPSREECVADRPKSNTPQQALTLLNDPTYIEAARAFAGRILKEGGSDTPSRLKWAYRQVLSRDPHEKEITLLEGVLQKQAERFKADPAAAKLLLGVGQTPGEVNAEELSAWTSVARILLNLHETITRL